MSDHKKIKDMTDEEKKGLKKLYNITYSNNQKDRTVYCNICEKEFPFLYYKLHERTQKHLMCLALKSIKETKSEKLI